MISAEQQSLHDRLVQGVKENGLEVIEDVEVPFLNDDVPKYLAC